MKLFKLFLFCIMASQMAFSQLEYGIKGGLNFDSAGKITKLNDDVISKGDLKSESGFNLGVYAQVDVLIFYLRSELQYTKVKRSFEDLNITTSRLELPVSLGYRVLGPLSFFGGPTVFYNLSNKTNIDSFNSLKNKLNFGYHLGVRFNLGSVGADIRYEKGVSSLVGNAVKVESTDLRPNQIVLGLSLKIN